MLQATDAKGELIYIWHFDRTELKIMQEKDIFYCPDCKEEVMLKIGTKNTPHFAHKVDSACVQHGEGTYHDNGKRQLFDWLQRQGYTVHLEPYIATIKQRPDLLIQFETKQIAVEFQCATIPPEDIRRRTRGYQHANIIPIWILGANRLQRTKPHSVNIPINDQTFLYQYHSRFPLSLFYYCSETRKFILYQDIIFLTKTKTVGNMKIQSLKQLEWKDLFIPRYRDSHLLKAYWKKEKERWKHKPVPFYQKQEIAWRQWLYVNKFNVQTLPAFIYLPISNQFQLSSSPWVWQSRLCIDLIMKKRSFTIDEARHLLVNHYFPSDYFPLLAVINDPVKEYLKMLVRIGILESMNENYYRIIHSTV